MGGRSAPRRYAGLFEERVVGKAAERQVGAPKLLLIKKPSAFRCGYPLKSYIISSREQRSPSSGENPELLRREEIPLSLPWMIMAFWSGVPGKWFRLIHLLSCCSDCLCQELWARQTPEGPLQATKMLETARAQGCGKAESVKPATMRSLRIGNLRRVIKQ